jgi:ribonuclease R
MKNTKNHREENKKNKILKGTIRAVRGNIAYFYSEQGILEAEISTRLLNTAMAGDSVEIKTFGKSKGGKPEGEVIKIIKRAKNFFVGTIEKTDKMTLVIPDDRKMKTTIEIPLEKTNILGANNDKTKNLNNGDKVKARVTKWNQYPNNSLGEIINILGKKGENSAEMHSIAIDKGFEVDFPEKVTEEANKIFQANITVPKEEYSKRKDLRNTLTFTIDPKTAKDFDDAISFKKLDNGNYEIGVHIADVSHYVTEKSELDKEAYKRGCSVYLPDRTIPMLPFELSDNLCSLNEGEEKLAFSAIFEMDSKAKVHSKWFGKSIIKSAKRFTYESAQEVIDSGSPLSSSRMRGSSSDSLDSRLHGNDRKENGKEHFYELDTLNKLSKILRKEKWLKGAIDFEQEEVAFELDESGKPIRIYKKERLDTHKLVEEFMLLANKEVAEFVYKHEKKTGKLFPLPYRIHDLPDKDRIAELSIFVKALGHELIIGKNGSITGKDMQALFAQVEGKAEEALVKTAAIRSMAKAIYSVKNIGHFGLAFEYYAHFTSPIRRYPDLLVHRILNKILSGESVGEKNFAFYENASRHSTDQEIKASEAEREGRKYKQVEFMQDKVGKTFDGLITGVTEWGIYAEDTETKAEGMIKLSSLGDDYYVLDPKKYAIVGEKTKRTFTLGQKIKIKLVSTDLDRKTMDYEIVN